MQDDSNISDDIADSYISDDSDADIEGVPTVHYVGVQNQVGSVATFTCSDGHILVGNTLRQCLPDGRWSGQAPGCILQSKGNFNTFLYRLGVLVNTLLDTKA